VILWVVLAALIVPGAYGGEIPESAFSSSLLVPGELLDQPALVFRFPQRAVEHPKGIIALAIGDTLDSSLGGVFKLGSQTVFVLVQDLPLTSRTTDYNSSFAESLRLLQTGWAAGIGSLRCGVALRGGLDHWEEEDDDDYLLTHAEGNLDHVEITAGFGLRWGDLFFDIVGEGMLEGEEVVETRSGADTSAYNAESGLRLGVGAITGFPLGSALSLRIAGDYQDRRVESDLSVHERYYSPFFGRYLVLSSRRHHAEKGRTWSAGVLLSNRRDADIRWRGYAHYRSLRGPVEVLSLTQTSHSSIVNSASFRRRELELGRIGLSGERELAKGFRLHVGTQVSYEIQRRRSDTDRVSVGHYVVSYDQSGEYEEARTVKKQFAWGLSRSWKGLDLTGSLSHTLAFEELLLLVDIRLRAP
jgi:hypothetical protein